MDALYICLVLYQKQEECGVHDHNLLLLLPQESLEPFSEHGHFGSHVGSLHWPLEKREIRISALYNPFPRGLKTWDPKSFIKAHTETLHRHTTNESPERSVVQSPDTDLLSKTLPTPQFSSLPSWYFVFVEENEVVSLQMFFHRLSRSARAAVLFGSLF